VSYRAPPAWILGWSPVGDFVRRFNAMTLPPGTRVRVSSWWREPAYHDSLPGAARDSQHLVGLALDVVPPTAALIQAAQRVGLVAFRHGDHDHVQMYAGGSSLVARAVAQVRAHFAGARAPAPYVVPYSARRTSA